MALKEEKVPVTSGKKKAYVRRETSAVSGMRVAIVHKNQTIKCRRTFSEPPVSRGRSVSKKRSIRGKSNHGTILQQPCKYHLKGTCTRSLCEYWHLPECRFYKTEAGCNARDECLFPHHKVDEQPNKKHKEELPFPQRKRKRRQKCSGCCENCTTIGLRLARLRNHWFLKEAQSLGETRCKKSWDQFEKYG